jgi:hypothetical protein
MGLANESVLLYESIKDGKKWKLRPVDEDSSHFSNEPFYVRWYDGKKKQMEPAGLESSPMRYRFDRVYKRQRRRA